MAISLVSLWSCMFEKTIKRDLLEAPPKLKILKSLSIEININRLYMHQSKNIVAPTLWKLTLNEQLVPLSAFHYHVTEYTDFFCNLKQ